MRRTYIMAKEQQNPQHQSTFMSSAKLFLTSESVTEGHPDKLCDQISDGVLDAILAQDPDARVACETATTTGLILVMGEITTTAWIDTPRIARETIMQAGYTRAKYGFDADTCGVIVSIKEQSKDIAMGVNEALEAKQGEMSPDDEIEAIGAGDQGMMIGFACNETEELMPLTISLAHKLTKRLSDVRKNRTLPWLRPDGKAQVTVEYNHGKPVRVDAVVVSAQHEPNKTHEEIEEAIKHEVIEKVIPASLMDEHTKFYINPTGKFEIGGPMGDAGLTGRKIIVDTYGGIARHGGGAFSGKDPTKVDRSAAYAARYVAKNIVASGLADKCEVQVSYAIGVAEPTSISVTTFGTGKIADAQIERLIRKHFDLRPYGIVKMLDLIHPVYQATASYGHFGRKPKEVEYVDGNGKKHKATAFSWEKTDKADELRKEGGLKK